METSKPSIGFCVVDFNVLAIGFFSGVDRSIGESVLVSCLDAIVTSFLGETRLMVAFLVVGLCVTGIMSDAVNCLPALLFFEASSRFLTSSASFALGIDRRFFIDSGSGQAIVFSCVAMNKGLTMLSLFKRCGSTLKCKAAIRSNTTNHSSRNMAR